MCEIKDGFLPKPLEVIRRVPGPKRPQLDERDYHSDRPLKPFRAIQLFLASDCNEYRKRIARVRDNAG